RGEHDMPQAEPFDAVEAWGPSVAVGVHDDLGARGERLVGHRVHVPDDEVGLEAGLDDRVGTAVDPDENRPVLAHVGTQRLEIFLVVVAAHDDEGVAALETGRDVGHPHAVEQQLALAAQEVHRVGGEGLELDGQPFARLVHRGGDRLGVLHGALGHKGVAVEDLPAVDPYAPPLAQPHDVGAEGVDERDARRDQDLGPEVRVPTRDRPRGVEHGRRPPFDEGLGRDAIDVEVVDHGDLAGLEPGREVLGARVDAHGCDDAAELVRGASGSQDSHLPYRPTPGPHGRGRRPATDTWQGQRPPARVSSSAACVRAASESSWPESMRASSRTRSGPSTGTTSDSVTVSLDPSCRATTRWRSANAATWARCVTTMTCADRASSASRRPTSTAAFPPTPASTSSNTKVAGRTAPDPSAVARATSRASMMRESSPPEALRPSGRAGAPSWDASRISTASAPHGPGSSSSTTTSRRAPSIARPA